MSLTDVSLDLYIRQWLKTATNGHVRIEDLRRGSFRGGATTFVVFKCDRCPADNVNIADDMFESTEVPWALQEWVNKHRHAEDTCKGFVPLPAAELICVNCGGLKAKHGVILKAPELLSEPLPQPRGRKFRR